MDEDMRPDKSHVVIEVLPEGSVVLALVEPGYESVLPSLNDRLSEFTERGVSIVASDGRTRFGKGADGESVQKALAKTAQQFGMI